jgi:hypothetical protein
MLTSAGGFHLKELFLLRAVSIADENIYYTKRCRLFMPIIQKGFGISIINKENKIKTSYNSQGTVNKNS